VAWAIDYCRLPLTERGVQADAMEGTGSSSSRRRSRAVIPGRTVFARFIPPELQIPAHRGQSFRRIADSVPVIADSF
jgi:hypothetical protein